MFSESTQRGRTGPNPVWTTLYILGRLALSLSQLDNSSRQNEHIS